MKMNRMIFAALCLLLLGVCAEISAQTRINFARGRTSATVSGTVASRATRSYVLGARNGQYLSANVSSKNDCIKFDNGATSISFVTNSGNNYLYLENRCGRSTSFSLTVSINYGSD